jgi:hypothetical protein
MPTWTMRAARFHLSGRVVTARIDATGGDVAGVGACAVATLEAVPVGQEPAGADGGAERGHPGASRGAG